MFLVYVSLLFRNHSKRKTRVILSFSIIKVHSEVKADMQNENTSLGAMKILLLLFRGTLINIKNFNEAYFGFTQKEKFDLPPPFAYLRSAQEQFKTQKKPVAWVTSALKPRVCKNGC